MAVPADRFGRRFHCLRLSVIEACNSSCGCCLPDGCQASSGLPTRLTADGIARLLRGFSCICMDKLHQLKAFGNGLVAVETGTAPQLSAIGR